MLAKIIDMRVIIGYSQNCAGEGVELPLRQTGIVITCLASTGQYWNEPLLSVSAL
jgi:hypothetical protein